MTAPSPMLRQELLRTIPNLRAFAMSLAGDPTRADDLVQETLVKAWDHLVTFQEGTNLKAWLFTILRNLYFSEHRKRRREVEDADGHLTERMAVHPAQPGHMDMVEFLAALESLPSHQREALILVGAEGFSYDEVAIIAGCAVGTVKSRVNRARCHLSQILGVRGAEEFGPDHLSEAILSQSSTGRVK